MMKSTSKLDIPTILKYLFHPTQHEIPPQNGGADLDIEVSEETTLGCRYFISDKKLPTILYFHGNGETVSDYDSIAPLYLNAGLNIIIATYRGYGRSSGTPTVTNLMGDSAIIYEKISHFIAEMELSEHLFVMGRSIGSAAAIEICSDPKRDIKGLILESGFADTLPLLQNIGVDVNLENIREEDGFGNIDKIKDIKLPTLILHGASDTLIPIHQAEKLQAFSGARTKKFFIIPGADHNTTIAAGGEHYFSTINGFIADITGTASWRKRRKKYRDNTGPK